MPAWVFPRVLLTSSTLRFPHARLFALRSRAGGGKRGAPREGKVEAVGALPRSELPVGIPQAQTRVPRTRTCTPHRDSRWRSLGRRVRSPPDRIGRSTRSRCASLSPGALRRSRARGDPRSFRAVLRATPCHCARRGFPGTPVANERHRRSQSALARNPLLRSRHLRCVHGRSHPENGRRNSLQYRAVQRTPAGCRPSSSTPIVAHRPVSSPSPQSA